MNKNLLQLEASGSGLGVTGSVSKGGGNEDGTDTLYILPLPVRPRFRNLLCTDADRAKASMKTALFSLLLEVAR